MRTSRPPCARLTALACLAAALLPGVAQAQFANHSIGIELGGTYIGNPHEQKPNVGSGGDLGLNATLYIESGFDLYFRVLFGVYRRYDCPVDVNNGHECNVVGIMPSIGFRYLFSEEQIRPYLGLNLTYLAFIPPSNDDVSYDALRLSLSPMFGVDFFVMDNFSLGPQIEFDLQLDLQGKFQFGGVLSFKLGWYF
jgi:hypothetical protein